MKLKSLLLFFSMSYAAEMLAQQPEDPTPKRKNDHGAYTIEQAISDNAQLYTISFNSLAFITGNYGADCFFPPGKVADFFGFQYMRDNDSNKMGHNTDFLTKIATNVISILHEDQLNKMIALAKEQEEIYTEFAKKRLVLIKAFRLSLEGNIPKNSKGLNKDAVINYCSELYALDGTLSYRRAEVIGGIVSSLTPEQIQAMDKLNFGNSNSWPMLPETLHKESMSHRANVGVMTYASELFSWYKGSLKADIYFCPERHGTYFGGFYLKDYPAMGNHGYSISTTLTGDAGKAFLEILNLEQREMVKNLIPLQKNNLLEIVKIRTSVSTLLRKFLSGGKADRSEVIELVKNYGKQDGEMSWNMVDVLTRINQQLTLAQREKLKKLRNLEILPKGAYIFSDLISLPEDIDCKGLF